MGKKNRYKKIVQQGNMNREPVASDTHALIITQTERGEVDIEDYLSAIKEAESVDYPNNSRLIDMIEDALMDGHLSSVREKRQAAILRNRIEFLRDGKIDKRVNEQIRSPWFRNLLLDIIDADEYGNTLVQFRRDGDWINYNKIPRKHYNAVRRFIKTRQSDIEGISFDEYRHILLIGDPRSLGRLTKAALYVIYKRNSMSDFAAFIEKFGRPFIEGEYDGYDEKIRRKLLDDLFRHSGGSVLVRPSGSKITLHDIASKGATGDLHKTFIQLCDEEISKLYLGSTLTVEVGDKGTQALGTVHQEGQEDVAGLTKQWLLEVLNYELTDILTDLGLRTRGGEFAFAAPKTKNLAARANVDRTLFDMGVSFPESYFNETYGVPAAEEGERVISKWAIAPEVKPEPGLEPKPDPEPEPEPEPEPKPGPEPEPPKEEQTEDPEPGGKKKRSAKNRLFGWLHFGRKNDFKAKMIALYRPAVSSAEAGFLFDQSLLFTALERIYKGEVNPQTEIEENLFEAFRQVLDDAVDQAFPGITESDPDFEFYEQLRTNNEVFAAFKTHKMQNEIAAELLDGDGVLKSFSEWKKDIESIVDHHTEHYLRVEYDTAVIRAHQAADWRQFERERDILPRVKWIPSTSVTPRESHRIFWNRVFEMDDPILNAHRPGDEWGCKCGLSSTDEPATDNSSVAGTGPTPSPGLGGNPGKTGMIFSEDHPYYTDAGKGAAKAVKQHLKNLGENE
ncbi:phage portal protein family protein [Alistipes sp.]|uniref:phage portal protein family protein n=1 Tax=Alistipes sp. TaxID=1872444 RepID=UPI003AEF5E5C